MKIFLLGAGGFIGSHLIEKILNTSSYEVVAFDLNGGSLKPFMGHERFVFHQGDILRRRPGSRSRSPRAMWRCPSRGLPSPRIT